MLKVCVLLFLSFISSSNSSSYRLSSEIVPSHYSIKIRPDFDNDIFYGEVEIYVRTKSDLQYITLHSSQLNITEVDINQKTATYSHQSNNKLSVRYENETLPPGEHTLHLTYLGRLKEKEFGFVKAYNEHNGEKRNIYVTELEPTNARKVFPCFDEPNFKANFNIRLISPNETYKAISNMPEIAKFATSKGIAYDFATSLKMSTYLVSFAFTDYPYYEEILTDKGRQIPIRIYTYNASKTNNAYAIECAKTAIQFYTNYTNISYPLPKLDMIEYTRTESAATENWGLITFRKGLLTNTLKVYSKSQIRLVVYHELSHFWFGNLVTNDWWNDIWLQEGFATYMSYKLLAIKNNVSQIKEMRDYQFDDHFESEINIRTIPIVSHLSSDKDISDKFNSITYDKGAGLLLMLEDVIGKAKFRLSIQTFLKRHAFKTATTNDFITVVEEIVTDVNVRSLMETFLYQNKFPLVEVQDLQNGTYILKQKVCKANRIVESSKEKWTIPIRYMVDQNDSPKLVWLDRDMEQLVIRENEDKLLIFNPEGKGMYKTILSRRSWKRIVENFQDIDEQVFETLISDAFYSFRFNMMDCDILIDLMQHTRSHRLLSYFFTFYYHLLNNLGCHGYTDEKQLFWEFIRKRIASVKLETKCDEEDSYKGEEYLESLKKCVSWIRGNLQKTSTNETMKP